MFTNILKFFIENTRVNYTLFFLITIAGIYSYMKMPKEIFPSFELDMVTVSGGYAGTSIDILDKIAVREIENEIKNLDGVKEMTTVISPGKFSIVVELRAGEDKYEFSDTIKDAVTNAKSNFPSDMTEPSVNVRKTGRDVIDISITSDKYSIDELIERANDLKDEIAALPDISEITIFGDSDKYISVRLDDRKIESYGITKESIYNAFSTLSYIYPVGEIESSKEKHYYISTSNGNKTVEEFLRTKLKVGEKILYIKDIADVKKKYKDLTTIARVNEKRSVNVSIKQTNEGNVLEVSKRINALVEKTDKSQADIEYYVVDDDSKRVRDRLNIVISNIIFGIILLTLLLILLVNFRMSAIIAIGIPTSFIIAFIYMHLWGYSINMISLVGILIALGIVVDDAIVVSESIQRHVEEGMEVKEAAFQGAKDMVEPVTIASLTTVFAFIPALMISGTMGEFIKLIPIAVSALVVASLIESFIFLPIHSVHMLKKDAKTLSWSRADHLYKKFIKKLMHYKKTFITVFVILVPLLTVVTIKNSKFQMFPKFDASNVHISLKANKNNKLEDTEKIVAIIEKEMLEVKEKYFIKDVTTAVGYRRDSAGNRERTPYVAYFTLELESIKPQNFVDKWVTPYLSFYEVNEDLKREEKSTAISKKLRKFLEEKNYEERFNLKDISVVERRAGPVKSDLKIGLISSSDKKIISSIETLKETLMSFKGVKSASDNADLGVSEIKLSVNGYGEDLGVTEADIGRVLSNIFLDKKKGTAIDDENLMDITIEANDKDSLSALKNYNFPLSSGRYIALKDIVQFEETLAFESVTKNRGEKTFYVFANVDSDVLTAGEALEKLEPTLEKLRQNGMKITFEGAKKKNKELVNDMVAASILALILILISLLYIFNSFKETFAVISVIPFSILGVLTGHFIMGINMTMPSVIGALGLAGVVINDGIIMMTYLKRAKTVPHMLHLASKRLRPIILTTVTTLVGLSTLIFFPTGQAVIFQPLAISLGFGLAWGTVLNLLYLPALYAIFSRKRLHDTDTRY